MDAYEEASAALEAGRRIRDMREKLSYSSRAWCALVDEPRAAECPRKRKRAGRPLFRVDEPHRRRLRFKWQLTPASPEMSVTETTARDAGRHRAGFFLGGVYAHFKSQDAAHAHIPVRGPRGRVVGDVTAVNVTLFSGQEEMIPAETFASGATRPPPDIPLMVFDLGGCVVGNVKAVNVVSASGHEEELSADFLCFDLHEKVFVATAKPRTGNISLHSDDL